MPAPEAQKFSGRDPATLKCIFDAMVALYKGMSTELFVLHPAGSDAVSRAALDAG